MRGARLSSSALRHGWSWTHGGLRFNTCAVRMGGKVIKRAHTHKEVDRNFYIRWHCSPNEWLNVIITRHSSFPRSLVGQGWFSRASIHSSIHFCEFWKKAREKKGLPSEIVAMWRRTPTLKQDHGNRLNVNDTRERPTGLVDQPPWSGPVWQIFKGSNQNHWD